MSDDLTVWGVGTVRTMRVHWMLREYGLDYQCHRIGPRTGETQTADYLAINPRGKVPALRHGDLILTESAAIVGYLSEVFEAPAGMAVPQDVASRAVHREWCYFIMTELDAASLYTIRRHGDLKHIYGESPVALAAAIAYFQKQLTAMAPRMEAGGPYLMGDRLCIADMLLASCTDWAIRCEIAIPDVVRAHRDRAASRPMYHDAFAFNYPDGLKAQV
jgi:glutathione S-transferase